MPLERLRLAGRVQGVGMRPYIHRLATRLGLKGQVCNDRQGVQILAQGAPAALDDFARSMEQSPPPLAQISAIRRERLAADQHAFADFQILGSAADAAALPDASVLLPDIATCEACRGEALAADGRRAGYPFCSCSDCGPRFSIQRQLPWDRANTSMAGFPLCAACAHEYQDQSDRRYHAQTMACADCGPSCWLVDRAGHSDGSRNAAAIEQAAERLAAGEILALKSIAGFHLACAADQPAAVAELRRRKRRPAKPLAVMVADLSAARRIALIDDAAAEALQSTAAPIVVLPLREESNLAEGIAPGLAQCGLMLPATALQHLLLRAFAGPLVMTSGNLSGEPPCSCNDDALRFLGGLADAVLLHDLDIVARQDDSLYGSDAAGPSALRIGRGLAPWQGRSPLTAKVPVLALGGQLKASFCMLRGPQWILSQHCGDLHRVLALADYEQALQHFHAVLQFRPERIAVDCHPDYQTHQIGRALAEAQGLPLIEVQHHHAHAVACLAEHEIDAEQGPWLAVSFDGLGYGVNGELWGGEFLRVDYKDFRRLGRLRPTPLPGGVAAMREPWRNLYAQIRQRWPWPAFMAQFGGLPPWSNWADYPLASLDTMLDSGLNCPPCSSIGRLFDAVACALDLAPEQLAYEGQAAMQLEAAVDKGALAQRAAAYPFDLGLNQGLHDLLPDALWPPLLQDLQSGVAVGVIAARFHRGLAVATARLCQQLRETENLGADVMLSGGAFQNRVFASCCIEELSVRGMQARQHRQIPANDGGLAVGQALIAAAQD